MKDITKTTKGSAALLEAKDASSRLKRDLMQDAFSRMFGDAKPPEQTGVPRVLFAVAHHSRRPGWQRAKEFAREIFSKAIGGLEMKFAFYGPDNEEGVRRCRIATRWVTDADAIAALMDRVECSCGCYVNIRSVLEEAVKQNESRPMRTVVIVGDDFHDSKDSLTEAAIAINKLRRAPERRSFSFKSDVARKPEASCNSCTGCPAPRIFNSIPMRNSTRSWKCSASTPAAARKPSAKPAVVPRLCCSSIFSKSRCLASTTKRCATAMTEQSAPGRNGADDPALEPFRRAARDPNGSNILEPSNHKLFWKANVQNPDDWPRFWDDVRNAASLDRWFDVGKAPRRDAAGRWCWPSDRES
jgi:hypothetical protein